MKSNIKGRTKMNSSIVLKRAWNYYKNHKFQTFTECLKCSWKVEKKNIITFDKVYKEYYNKYYHYIDSKLNNSESALELTQDLFIKINTLLPNYKPTKAKITTYIGRICNNLIIDYYRTNNKRYNNTTYISNFVDEKGNEFFEIPIEDKQNTNKDIALSVNSAIENIKNPTLQAIANLYLLDNKKYAEIAEFLNIPLGSVKQYINRVKKLLKADLIYLKAA